MTKEEIIKEAQEQVNYCTPIYSESFIQGYLAGAEPREKQIEIDAEQIRALQKQNGELQDKLKNLASVAEVRLANWQKYEKENAELKNKLEHRNCLDCSNHSSKLRMKTLELEKECTKAKEIIGECLPALKRGSWWELHDKAEAFLNSEVDK